MSSRPERCASGNYKFMFNLRGDDGAQTGGLAVDSNLGWKGGVQIRRHRPAGLRPLAGPAGALRHLHEQLHGTDLDAGGHRRRDEETDGDLRQAPAAQAAERGYTGPITLSNYERFQWVREQLQKGGHHDLHAHGELAPVSAAPGAGPGAASSVLAQPATRSEDER